MKPLQNQYQDLLEGKMSKFNFLNNVKRNLPNLVSNVTSFDDAVKILKSKRILSEITVAKEVFSPADKNALEKIVSKYVKDSDDIEKEMEAYHSQGYQGFSDMLKANLSRDEDFQTWTEYTKDQEQYKKEMGESKLNEDWGSSDQATFNKAIHDDLGQPSEMPMPFDSKFQSAVESAVDFWWDDWDEYATDRDGLIDHAKRAYYRSYFPEKFAAFQEMFSENKEKETSEEDEAIIAAYNDEQEKHTLPGGHLREDVDINPKLVADIDRVNPLEYNTGIDYELDLSGDFSAEGLEKAVKKVLKNLAKDQIYYTNLKAELTSKINKKQVEAAKSVELKKDNQVDKLNQVKTLVKKELANTKVTLGKQEKVTKVHPQGVKLMKEEEEKFDPKQHQKDEFKKFSDKMIKQVQGGPATKKNTLKDKIKEYITKQLKKEAVKFTIGQTGQEHEYKNPKDAPEFEKDLKAAGVKFTKSNV